MTDLLNILFKAFWCGCAATGFGILFNTPRRILFFVSIGGFLAGFVKYLLMDTSASSGIIVATFAAATAIGIASVPIASRLHIPAIIFSIPSAIPMVPGAFAYRTMVGLIKLSGAIGDDYSRILSETIHNGVTTLFVVMAISIGVVIPMFLFRKKMVADT